MYSDPTANKALGSIKREFNALCREAQHLRMLKNSGKLSAEEERQARARFKGIYRPIIVYALDLDDDIRRYPD